MTATTRLPGTPIPYALLPDIDEPAWRIAAELPDGSIAVATDLPALVTQLIDGYDTDVHPHGQVRPFMQRDAYARKLVEARTVLFAAAVAGATIDPDGPSAPLPAAVVPKLVLATDYAPYSDVALPTGVQVIDPSSDMSLISSLHELGEITVTVVE